MALITVHAVVDIPVHTAVLRIRLSLRVATSALKYGVVTWIRVAGCAHAVGIAVVHGEPRVVECRACPRCRRVAGRTRCREHRGRRGVNRIGGGRVVGFVTAIAICGQRRVVVIDVAVGAGNGRVSTRQRKRRYVVIERPIGP